MITLLIELLQYLLQFYIYALIVAAIFSMATAFGVLDTRNRLVWTIGDFLYRVTDPVLRPIRNILPNFGNIDLSPLIAILLLGLLQKFLGRVAIALAYGSVQPLFF